MWILLIVFVIGVATASHSMGYKAGTKEMQNEAIQRSYAEYNSSTGVWQWLETENIVEDRSVEQKVEQSDF